MWMMGKRKLTEDEQKVADAQKAILQWAAVNLGPEESPCGEARRISIFSYGWSEVRCLPVCSFHGSIEVSGLSSMRRLTSESIRG
jgi:hypothetical protein